MLRRVEFDASDKGNFPLRAVTVAKLFDPDNEESDVYAFGVRHLKNAMALIATSVRGSQASIQRNLKRSTLNAEQVAEDVKQTTLAVGFGLFVALALYLIPRTSPNFKVEDAPFTTYMTQMIGRHKRAFDPLKLDKPRKSIPVPTKEKADLNILQRYKTIYNNSKKEGAKHLEAFYELFSLPDYYTAVEDSSPILLKMDERKTFVARNKRSAQGSYTSPKKIKSFATLLEMYPSIKTEDNMLYNAIEVYYRVSYIIIGYSAVYLVSNFFDCLST
jgi:hypothetical protein